MTGEILQMRFRYRREGSVQVSHGRRRKEFRLLEDEVPLTISGGMDGGVRRHVKK